MDDQEILSQLKAKDPRAFEALYEAYHRRLKATAIHFLGYEDQDHLDVVQETFAVALKKLPRTKIQTNLYGWLNRICALLCFERLRGRKRTLNGLEEELESLAAKLGAARHRQQQEDSELEERLALLRRLIGEMDRPCRDILRLRDLQGLSYAALASKLKLPLGTAMSKLARCRQALKRLVQRELEQRKP